MTQQELVATEVSDDLRGELRAWLEQNWHGVDDAEWRSRLADSGWAAPTMALHCYGRELSPEDAAVVAAEFGAVGAPGSCRELADDIIATWVRIVGATFEVYGTPELNRSVMRPLLTNELGEGVCLYSEPGAGSDLASLQTKAELDGEVFVINGQKVWSSGAAEADWALLLARTDWDVPKHKGISLFIMPMHQEGVEVRPIKQITGESHFSEVFMSDAKVPVGNLIGELNDGWRVLQTALAAERDMLSDPSASISMRKSGELKATNVSVLNDVDDFVAEARSSGRSGDVLVRQKIAQLLTWRMAHRWNTERSLTAHTHASVGVATALPALAKLARSRILHEEGRLRAQLLGQEALLYGPGNPMADDVNHSVMEAFINSVGGGSDQIQRNIIGERVLGLPRGPEPDRTIPFRDVRKSESSPPK